MSAARKSKRPGRPESRGPDKTEKTELLPVFNSMPVSCRTRGRPVEIFETEKQIPGEHQRTGLLGTTSVGGEAGRPEITLEGAVTEHRPFPMACERNTSRRIVAVGLCARLLKLGR